MSNLSLKTKIIGIIVALGLILIAIFQAGLYTPSQRKVSEPAASLQNQKAEVVSTNPASLDGATILPTQAVEITFNKPLVNDPARITLEPQVKYRTELSSDHKTLKVIPTDAYKLGQSYTLTIKDGYSFDTGEKLESDRTFHFQTVSYNGV